MRRKRMRRREGRALKNPLRTPESVQMKELDFPSPEYPATSRRLNSTPTEAPTEARSCSIASDRKGYRIKIHFLTGEVKIEQ